MMHDSNRRLLICVTLISVAVGGSQSVVHAQGVRILPDKKTDSKDATERLGPIEKALDKRIDIDLDEVPLLDFVQQIEKTCGIQIELNVPEVDPFGVGRGPPITRKLNDVSLRSALKLILHDLELDYYFQDEALQISARKNSTRRNSTRELVEVKAKIVIRVYDVGDLVFRQSRPQPIVYSPLVQNATDFDDIMTVITDSVAPASWDQVGGPASISSMEAGDRYVLAIAQTHQAHAHIRQLLKELRDVKPHRTAAVQTNADAPPARNEIIVRIYPVTGAAAADISEMADLVRHTVGADVWNEAEGKLITGKANAILVKHRQEVHDQVYRILVGLKVIQSRRLHRNRQRPIGGSIIPVVGGFGTGEN